MRCRPSKWLWGVPPLVLITALALFGVRGQIERDLTDRTAAMLQNEGLPWAVASFVGRDAVLKGLSFSRTERDGAIRAIENVWGVRAVVDRSDLIASPETYTWWARKDDQKIKIRGHVPTKDDRRSILGFVKATMPNLEIDDQMLLAGGSPPRQAWLGSVSFALLQLGQFTSGTVRLSGNDLVVAGEAKTTAAYHVVNKSLASQLPAGVKLKTAKITPPVAKPFAWRVKYTKGTVSLTGRVPSETDRAQIMDRVRNLFPGVEVKDSMELASGAPDSWLWAVSASLTQLRRLDSGRVKLKDTVLEFEGVAVDKNTAKDVTASIRNSLPSTYRSTEKISVRKQPGSDAPPSGKRKDG